MRWMNEWGETRLGEMRCSELSRDYCTDRQSRGVECSVENLGRVVMPADRS